MRDTTECINSIGYALFAVIKAIFINRNSLEMIMNFIKINKLKKNIKSKKKSKKKTQGTVTGFELAPSMSVDKRSIHYATNSTCDWFVHIIF